MRGNATRCVHRLAPDPRWRPQGFASLRSSPSVRSESLQGSLRSGKAEVGSGRCRTTLRFGCRGGGFRRQAKRQGGRVRVSGTGGLGGAQGTPHLVSASDQRPTAAQVAGHKTSRSLDRRDPPDIVFCRRRRTSPGSQPSRAEAEDVTMRNRSSARSSYPPSSSLRFPIMNSSSIGTAFAMNDNNSTLLEHKLDTRTRTSQRLPTVNGERGAHLAGRFPASQRLEHVPAETGPEASGVWGTTILCAPVPTDESCPRGPH